MSRILKGERVVPGEVFDAQRDAPRIREEARREGFEVGRQEGLAAVTELLARARAAATRREEEAEPELRRLAVAIAEKILGRELALSSEAVVDVVRTALRAARARREITIRVHPDDVSAVLAARERLARELARPADLAVIADGEVGRGGCVIDTEVGAIDARLEVQLAAIERALVGERD